MDWLNLIYSAIPYVLGISVIAGFLTLVLNLLKEVSDVLVAVVNALEDKQLTKEEVANIVKEAKEVVEAAKKFVHKK